MGPFIDLFQPVHAHVRGDLRGGKTLVPQHLPDGCKVATAAKKVGGWNFTGYSNAKFDELSDAMLKEVDQAKRDKMVADAWALAVADIPYLPLHHQLIVWAMSDKVTIPIFANDSPNFKYSKMK